MALFLSTFVNGFSQESQTEIIDKKHSIHLEIGGRAFLFGSLNYEYAFLNRFSFGGGLVLLNISRGEKNNTAETGKYFDMASSQTIYGNYFVGKNKHKLLLTAGFTNYSSFNRNKYPSKTETYNETSLGFNGGVGYQATGNKTFFRVTLYGLNLPESNGFFPIYIPWIGLNTGIKF